MSRTPIFADNKSIARTLKAFVDGQPLTYDHKQRLIASGHLEEAGRATTDAVKAAGRGRHKIVYQPSKAGKNLINLSRNWK